ncbi:glutamyl-tRNA reductase [Desulfurispira natronophila]|uniref:Glutamyl-tRNA reductase n=1 Tax=Desulfurispira natronophila TaxID=682562 RepID=A0A7W7Y5Z7_9BACT|nr:glutamyl-tRNA reductase [Desulfurispira natronophila]MBB5022736.1 glutamyl-tRNA reductase [Desulfurispira natronophila]
MTLAAFSFSYKSVPVELREQLAFTAEQLRQMYLNSLALGFSELVVVSTCNRVEWYGITCNTQQTMFDLYGFLSHTTGIDRHQLEDLGHLFTDQEAVDHLFRVSASLESMVLGEPQVLGQVKNAYAQASDIQNLRQLDKLFIRAFKAAKRVRNETAIAQNAVSVSFAAVELARKIFEKLDDKRCMLIGAGEMCELAAKHLHAHGVKQFVVANRTLERAERLATIFSGKACTLEQLEEHLSGCDIIISSTGAQEPVITKPMVRRALKKRGMQNPMFFIDIAVPRDVEESVNDITMAFRYDIDDLQEVVEENKRTRVHEKEKALLIIEQERNSYQQWLEVQDISPYIVALRQRMQQILEAELAHCCRGVDDAEQERMQRFGRRLMNKWLHSPSANIKRLVADEGGSGASHSIDTFKKLFDLEQI